MVALSKSYYFPRAHFGGGKDSICKVPPGGGLFSRNVRVTKTSANGGSKMGISTRMKLRRKALSEVEGK
jgi:hypothetical protein